MSQDYIFNFSHGSSAEQQQHQIRMREKIRVQGFEPPLVGLEDGGGLPAVYETGAGMLSEMFNFPTGGSELLVNQLNYQQRNHRPTNTGDWYGNNTAQAMQLFLTNPSHDHQSPSSESPNNPSSSSSSTLHMLLPNQQSFGQGHFGHSTPQYTWGSEGGVLDNNQGLSLSLSSTLQHLEAAKVEDLRIGDDSYFDQYRNLHIQGGGLVMGQNHHIGYGSSSLGVVKVLRNSRYVKAAQELLEEFCSVGRGQFKKNKSKHNNPNQNPTNSGGGASSSSSKAPQATLSSSERIEHQKRKVKLSSMLDEVDRRYNHYCEQMQMVVNSFDLVMGFGAAVPYTALAQKAMSRHFRCLKDAIAAQLKYSCELLGEKDVGCSGVTKGETPRLKLLEQCLRQQRAFHQIGMMEQEAWRPQRGLPERSVNILRAWLFEHFLHPYPSDADKHLLARQTGLSRNQVSNWFINARVRLWKPMVEEMYQQEGKEEEEEEDEDEEENKLEKNNNSNIKNGPLISSSSSQTPMQPPSPTYTTTVTPTPAKRSQINNHENDTSILAINTQNCFSENQATTMSYSYTIPSTTTAGATTTTTTIPPSFSDGDTCRRGNMIETGDDDIGSTLIRFGPNGGDVSLTLGLRHAGNLPDKTSFSVRDFGGC